MPELLKLVIFRCSPLADYNNIQQLKQYNSLQSTDMQ